MSDDEQEKWIDDFLKGALMKWIKTIPSEVWTQFTYSICFNH